MNLLALDTSSIACSVALQIGSSVTERHEEKPQEHTRLLMPMIRSLLEESGIALSDLDAIVLGNGPGSFIGMRIAASVAQGLAFGSSLDVVPVSSLAAVAAQVFDESDAQEVVVAQDAHMNEVYLGRYRRDRQGLPADVVPEQLHGKARIAGLDDAPRLGAGLGWQRYPDLRAVNEDLMDEFVGPWHPHARYLLALGAAGIGSGKAIDPKDLVPAYLRQKVAEKPALQP